MRLRRNAQYQEIPNKRKSSLKHFGKKLALALPADAIHAFAFDLKHHNVTSDFENAPAVVLTSLLKKGCHIPVKHQINFSPCKAI